MWSYQALIILMILLPGFLTRAIVGTLTPRRRFRDLASVVESFLFSFFIYLILLYVIPADVMHLLAQISKPDLSRIVILIRPVVLLSLILSVIIGLLWSAMLNHDVLHRVLRWIGITRSTSRSSSWLDIFSDMGNRSIIVTLDDGRRLAGYPEYYSTDQEEGCLFLREPYWIVENGEVIPCDTYGVLLMKEQGIKRIDFMLFESEVTGQ